MIYPSSDGVLFLESFGTRLEGIKATDPLVIGAVVALLALLAIGHFIVRRQAATTLKRPA